VTARGPGAAAEAVKAGDSCSTALVLGEEIISLGSGKFERLLRALLGLGQRDAAVVREQIMALRLLGGVIRLTPTEAELAALEVVLAGLADDEPQLGSELKRLTAGGADEMLAAGESG
jgi:hypothetical protein